MSCEPHGCHLRVSDGDPARIAASIDLRADTQSRPTMRGTNQVHDGGQIDEGVPRQFMAMCEKRRCSIRFHLLVPGGK